MRSLALTLVLALALPEAIDTSRTYRVATTDFVARVAAGYRREESPGPSPGYECRRTGARSSSAVGT